MKYTFIFPPEDLHRQCPRNRQQTTNCLGPLFLIVVPVLFIVLLLVKLEHSNWDDNRLQDRQEEANHASGRVFLPDTCRWEECPAQKRTMVLEVVLN